MAAPVGGGGGGGRRAERVARPSDDEGGSEGSTGGSACVRACGCVFTFEYTLLLASKPKPDRALSVQPDPTGRDMIHFRSDNRIRSVNHRENWKKC